MNYKKYQFMVMEISRGDNKENIEELLSQLGAAEPVKGIDAYKYCGVLNLEESPEEIQKKVRGEWD